MMLGRYLSIGLSLAAFSFLSTKSSGQQLDQEEQEQQPFQRVPIMGPLTSGGIPQRIDPPSLEEVLAAIEDQPAYAKTVQWAETHKDQLQVTKEVIADYIDPPRFFPLIGPAQRHHAHYRVSLRRKPDGPVRVVFIDHNHIHSMKVASVTIRAGTPPHDAVPIDEQLGNQLKDWNHSVELFGGLQVDRRDDKVIVVAKQASLNLQLSKAIRFQAKGQELTVVLTPDRTMTGTLQGDVEQNLAGETLRCDSLTFSSDGEVIASGNVKLSGTNKKTQGQLRLDGKPLAVTKETILHRLPSRRSPIVDFIADQVELDLNEDTITIRPK